MNLFGANLEAANLALPDSLLARLRAAGTHFAIMDAALANDVTDTVAVTRDVRLVYAVEIATHPLGD